MKIAVQRLIIDLGQESIHVGTAKDGIILSERNEKLFIPPAAILSSTKKSAKMAPLSSFSSVYADGRIVDVEGMSGYLSTVLSFAGKSLLPLLPHQVLASIPASSHPAAKESLYEALRITGFSSVTLCAAPLAAAVGAGFVLPVKHPVVVVSLGESMSEVAVVTLSECAKVQRLSFCASTLYRQMVMSLFARYGMRATLEEMKNLVQKNPQAFLNREEGRKKTVLPGHLEKYAQLPDIFWQEIREISVDSITSELQFFLSSLSTEEIGSVADHGILLTGGFAKIDGLAGYCSAAVGLPVFSLPQSDLLVAQGLVKILPLLK